MESTLYYSLTWRFQFQDGSREAPQFEISVSRVKTRKKDNLPHPLDIVPAGPEN